MQDLLFFFWYINCIYICSHVTLKNNLQGAVESVSIGEIRLSIRQSLVKLGVGFISRDPKLQVLICDLEVVMRASSKSTKKVKSRKSRKSGRGKWMVVANMTRFLSVTVTELVVKVTIVPIKLGLMSGEFRCIHFTHVPKKIASYCFYLFTSLHFMTLWILKFRVYI